MEFGHTSKICNENLMGLSNNTATETVTEYFSRSFFDTEIVPIFTDNISGMLSWSASKKHLTFNALYERINKSTVNQQIFKEAIQYIFKHLLWKNTRELPTIELMRNCYKTVYADKKHLAAKKEEKQFDTNWDAIKKGDSWRKMCDDLADNRGYFIGHREKDKPQPPVSKVKPSKDFRKKVEKDLAEHYSSFKKPLHKVEESLL